MAGAVNIERYMNQTYYLEGYLPDTNSLRRFDLMTFPALVGRESERDIYLNTVKISRHHAKLTCENDRLAVEDLGSTNGTFVNHQRIESKVPLQVGDVLHFADLEFRVGLDENLANPATAEATIVGLGSLPKHFPTQVRQFFDLISNKRTCCYRQLITDSEGRPFAYELLGRGTHPELSAKPVELFKLAASLGAEVSLAELLRQQCFQQAADAGIELPLFFNAHPKESDGLPNLIDGLEILRERHPDLELVFEVHEAAITDLERMAELRMALRELNIALAYDDFGAGRARMLELIKVPPDYLKYDLALVQSVTSVDCPAYKLLASLNPIVHDLGIKTLAEGVELVQTATLCKSLGIDLFQGYLFGRPEPIVAA